MKFRFSSFAVALIAVGVAACAPTNPTTPPTGNIGADVQGDANPPAPSAPVSTPPVASPAPSASPSASPSTVAQAAVGAGTLRGMVYDDAGAPLASGDVWVRSLSTSAPFETRVSIVSGSYVANQVPAGVPVQVTAMRSGWTSRTQVTNVIPPGRQQQGTDLHFGGTSNAYFVSKYPEIASVEPVTKSTNVSADKLFFKLTLSEPLDDTNRRRLERALRVIPANDIANGGQAGTTSDLEAQEDNGLALNLQIPYQITRGTSFLDEDARTAQVTWSADGLTASLTFDAPLIAAQSDEAKYQVVLISDGTRIVDGEGNQLGTDGNGSLGSYPLAGGVIHSVFKPDALAIRDIPGLTNGSREERWASTHTNTTTFRLAKDKVSPTLVGVSVSRPGTDTRIALTFSEPMAAFDGTSTGYSSAQLTELANYTFAIARTPAQLDGTKLDGDVDPGAVLDPRVTATYGTATADREKEFRFDTAAFTATRAGAVTGQVLVEVDPLDASRVLLTLIGRSQFFASEISGIKARAEGLQDPAGNNITDTAADRNIKIGTL